MEKEAELQLMYINARGKLSKAFRLGKSCGEDISPVEFDSSGRAKSSPEGEINV